MRVQTLLVLSRAPSEHTVCHLAWTHIEMGGIVVAAAAVAVGLFVGAIVVPLPFPELARICKYFRCLLEHCLRCDSTCLLLRTAPLERALEHTAGLVGRIGLAALAWLVCLVLRLHSSSCVQTSLGH